MRTPDPVAMTLGRPCRLHRRHARPPTGLALLAVLRRGRRSPARRAGCRPSRAACSTCPAAERFAGQLVDRRPRGRARHVRDAGRRCRTPPAGPAAPGRRRLAGRWTGSADASVDLVLAESQALSLCLATEVTVEQLVRVLRPGGRLLLVVDSLVLGPGPARRPGPLGRARRRRPPPTCVLVPRRRRHPHPLLLAGGAARAAHRRGPGGRRRAAAHRADARRPSSGRSSQGGSAALAHAGADRAALAADRRGRVDAGCTWSPARARPRRPRSAPPARGGAGRRRRTEVSAGTGRRSSTRDIRASNHASFSGR